MTNGLNASVRTFTGLSRKVVEEVRNFVGDGNDLVGGDIRVVAT